jgi:hypothetical protein
MGQGNSEEAGKQKSRTEPGAAFEVNVRVLKIGHESLCTRDGVSPGAFTGVDTRGDQAQKSRRCSRLS